MLWAFRKLSKRDRVVLVIAGVLFFAALVSCLFLVLSGAVFKDVSFPHSTLSKESSLQSYKLGKYDDLSVEIGFPGTAYSIDLKGREVSGTDEGALFDAEDGLYIFAGTVGRGEDTSSFMVGCLPSLFNENYVSGEYLEKLRDEGYLNTALSIYECGVVTVGDEDYYCMSYRYSPSSGGRDILFGTARSEKNASTLALKLDKSMVLDKMFMTIKKDPNGEVAVPVLEPLQEAVPSGTENVDGYDSEEGDVYSSSRAGYVESSRGTDTVPDNGVSDGVSDEESAGDKLHDTLKKQKEKEFMLAYPGQEVFTVSANVPEELAGKEVGIEVFFTEANTDVYYATATHKETGRVESAENLNDTHSGQVLFYIDNCEPGEWVLEVERGQALGTYEVSVLKADVLRIFAENNGPD